MLVQTGEQIREILVVGGSIVGVAILLLIIVFLRRKMRKDNEE